MPSKKKKEIEPILGHKLALEEWLSRLFSENWEYVFPNNCFPTDTHAKEYLSKIQGRDDGSFRALLRRFLNKSTRYGCDRGRAARMIEEHGRDIFNEESVIPEFDRRSLPLTGPQWEGITWAIDLLPHKPQDAIQVINSYTHIHNQYLTDQMAFGHGDAVALIKARYTVNTSLSCFISYGGPDHPFAQQLHDSLVAQNIQAFFFPVHAMPGEKLHAVMRNGVNQYDRVILICSKSSLARHGVLNELTETLQREAREGGKAILIPIRLDDFMLSEWKPDDPGVAQAVRDRVVADFTGAQEDQEKYKVALQRLITALHSPLR